MTEQVRKHHQRRTETKDSVEDQPATGKQDKKTPAELKAELDDLLDEVDECLEENAADFVAAYRQKGGE